MMEPTTNLGTVSTLGESRTLCSGHKPSINKVKTAKKNRYYRNAMPEIETPLNYGAHPCQNLQRDPVDLSVLDDMSTLWRRFLDLPYAILLFLTGILVKITFVLFGMYQQTAAQDESRNRCFGYNHKVLVSPYLRAPSLLKINNRSLAVPSSAVVPVKSHRYLVPQSISLVNKHIESLMPHLEVPSARNSSIAVPSSAVAPGERYRSFMSQNLSLIIRPIHTLKSSHLPVPLKRSLNRSTSTPSTAVLPARSAKTMLIQVQHKEPTVFCHNKRSFRIPDKLTPPLKEFPGIQPFVQIWMKQEQDLIVRYFKPLLRNVIKDRKELALLAPVALNAVTIHDSFLVPKGNILKTSYAYNREFTFLPFFLEIQNAKLALTIPWAGLFEVNARLCVLFRPECIVKVDIPNTKCGAIVKCIKDIGLQLLSRASSVRAATKQLPLSVLTADNRPLTLKPVFLLPTLKFGEAVQTFSHEIALQKLKENQRGDNKPYSCVQPLLSSDTASKINETGLPIIEGSKAEIPGTVTGDVQPLLNQGKPKTRRSLSPKDIKNLENSFARFRRKKANCERPKPVLASASFGDHKAKGSSVLASNKGRFPPQPNQLLSYKSKQKQRKLFTKKGRCEVWTGRSSTTQSNCKRILGSVCRYETENYRTIKAFNEASGKKVISKAAFPRTRTAYLEWGEISLDEIFAEAQDITGSEIKEYVVADDFREYVNTASDPKVVSSPTFKCKESTRSFGTASWQTDARTLRSSSSLSVELETEREKNYETNYLLHTKYPLSMELKPNSANGIKEKDGYAKCCNKYSKEVERVSFVSHSSSRLQTSIGGQGVVLQNVTSKEQCSLPSTSTVESDKDQSTLLACEEAGKDYDDMAKVDLDPVDQTSDEAQGAFTYVLEDSPAGLSSSPELQTSLEELAAALKKANNRAQYSAFSFATLDPKNNQNENVLEVAEARDRNGSYIEERRFSRFDRKKGSKLDNSTTVESSISSSMDKTKKQSLNAQSKIEENKSANESTSKEIGDRFTHFCKEYFKGPTGSKPVLSPPSFGLIDAVNRLALSNKGASKVHVSKKSKRSSKFRRRQNHKKSHTVEAKKSAKEIEDRFTHFCKEYFKGPTGSKPVLSPPSFGLIDAVNRLALSNKGASKVEGSQESKASFKRRQRQNDKKSHKNQEKHLIYSLSSCDSSQLSDFVNTSEVDDKKDDKNDGVLKENIKSGLTNESFKLTRKNAEKALEFAREILQEASAFLKTKIASSRENDGERKPKKQQQNNKSIKPVDKSFTSSSVNDTYPQKVIAAQEIENIDFELSQSVDTIQTKLPRRSTEERTKKVECITDYQLPSLKEIEGAARNIRNMFSLVSEYQEAGLANSLAQIQPKYDQAECIDHVNSVYQEEAEQNIDAVLPLAQVTDIQNTNTESLMFHESLAVTEYQEAALASSLAQIQPKNDQAEYSDHVNSVYQEEAEQNIDAMLPLAQATDIQNIKTDSLFHEPLAKAVLEGEPFQNVLYQEPRSGQILDTNQEGFVGQLETAETEHDVKQTSTTVPRERMLQNDSGIDLKTYVPQETNEVNEMNLECIESHVSDMEISGQFSIKQSSSGVTFQVSGDIKTEDQRLLERIQISGDVDIEQLPSAEGLKVSTNFNIKPSISGGEARLAQNEVLTLEQELGSMKHDNETAMLQLENVKGVKTMLNTEGGGTEPKEPRNAFLESSVQGAREEYFSILPLSLEVGHEGSNHEVYQSLEVKEVPVLGSTDVVALLHNEEIEREKVNGDERSETSHLSAREDAVLGSIDLALPHSKKVERKQPRGEERPQTRHFSTVEESTDVVPIPLNDEHVYARAFLNDDVVKESEYGNQVTTEKMQQVFVEHQEIQSVHLWQDTGHQKEQLLIRPSLKLQETPNAIELNPKPTDLTVKKTSKEALIRSYNPQRHSNEEDKVVMSQAAELIEKGFFILSDSGLVEAIVNPNCVGREDSPEKCTFSSTFNHMTLPTHLQQKVIKNALEEGLDNKVVPTKAKRTWTPMADDEPVRGQIIEDVDGDQIMLEQPHLPLSVSSYPNTNTVFQPCVFNSWENELTPPNSYLQCCYEQHKEIDVDMMSDSQESVMETESYDDMPTNMVSEYCYDLASRQFGHYCREITSCLATASTFTNTVLEQPKAGLSSPVDDEVEKLAMFGIENIVQTTERPMQPVLAEEQKRFPVVENGPGFQSAVLTSSIENSFFSAPVSVVQSELSINGMSPESNGASTNDNQYITSSSHYPVNHTTCSVPNDFTDVLQEVEGHENLRYETAPSFVTDVSRSSSHIAENAQVQDKDTVPCILSHDSAAECTQVGEELSPVAPSVLDLCASLDIEKILNLPLPNVGNVEGEPCFDEAASIKSKPDNTESLLEGLSDYDIAYLNERFRKQLKMLNCSAETAIARMKITGNEKMQFHRSSDVHTDQESSSKLNHKNCQFRQDSEEPIKIDSIGSLIDESALLSVNHVNSSECHGIGELILEQTEKLAVVSNVEHGSSLSSDATVKQKEKEKPIQEELADVECSTTSIENIEKTSEHLLAQSTVIEPEKAPSHLGSGRKIIILKKRLSVAAAERKVITLDDLYDEDRRPGLHPGSLSGKKRPRETLNEVSEESESSTASKRRRRVYFSDEVQVCDDDTRLNEYHSHSLVTKTAAPRKGILKNSKSRNLN